MFEEMGWLVVLPTRANAVGISISVPFSLWKTILEFYMIIWEKCNIFRAKTKRCKAKWYSSFQLEPKLHSWFSNINVIKRKIIVFLNCPHSRHIYLLLNLYRLGVTDSPNCSGSQIGDVNYIILGCP